MRWPIAALLLARRGMPPVMVERRSPSAPPLEPSDPTPADDDPIYSADAYLDSRDVTFAGRDAYCACYRAPSRESKHSRAVVLIVDGDERDAPTARSLAERIALSCECVALLPRGDGGGARWEQGRMAQEVLEASTWLNKEHGVEALGLITHGRAAAALLGLLACGAVEAHAAIAICPSADGDPGELSRAAREISVPLLSICGVSPPGDGARAIDELRTGLAVNSRLRSDFYVAPFECPAGFMLRPRGEEEGGDADRAASLAVAWLDRYVPEGLTR